MKSSISLLTFSFYNKCYRETIYDCSYSRERIMSSVSLRQYPVGYSHHINNGMRAADGPGDTLRVQEKAPSRGMRYVAKHIANKIACCRKKHIITYSYAYTLKQGRTESRRHHMHPWIYGSHVGAWIRPLRVFAVCHTQQMGVEAKARATEEDRVNTTTCMPGTYDKKLYRRRKGHAHPHPRFS